MIGILVRSDQIHPDEDELFSCQVSTIGISSSLGWTVFSPALQLQVATRGIGENGARIGKADQLQDPR
jgi:hypothetical protein